MAKDSLYNDLREQLENELLKVTKSGELNEKSLEVTYKILDCVKDIDEICEKDMEISDMYDSASSQRGYSRGRSMGYPYYMGGSYEGRNYGGGTSRGYGSWSSRNSAVDHLQTMVDGAKNEQERMMYQRWLDEARQMM